MWSGSASYAILLSMQDYNSYKLILSQEAFPEENWANLIIKLLDRINPQSLIFLEGKVGAGKTTFVRELCEQLQVHALVSSPTFSLHHEYKGVLRGEALYIHHLDLYRLSEPEDIFELGLEECLADRQSLRLVEWPDRLIDIKADYRIIIEGAGEATRSVKLYQYAEN